MRKSLIKKVVVAVMMMAMMMPAFALTLSQPAYALDEDTIWGGKKDDIQSGMGDVGARDPRDIAASIIRIMMGFLGLIAVVIILIGGFKWMTAGGNDEKATQARKLIMAGVIGLVIILAAFGIATFVINQLLDATGGA